MFEPGPRRLHPVWIVYSAIRSLRAMIIPLAVVVLSGGAVDVYRYGIGLGIAVVLVATRAIAWMRFVYELTPEGIRVRYGLLSTNERFLPRERIQAVDVTEDVLHRLLGVVELRIESAAGGGKAADVALEALDRGVADRLRAELLARAPVAPAVAPVRPATPEATPAADGELIARVSYVRLLAAGATAGQVGPLVAVAAAATQLADDVLPGAAWRRAQDFAPNPTVQLALLLVVGAAAVAWLFSIASTLLTYGGFELRLIDDRLHASYGVLERRKVTIPQARVQAVTVHEGLLRQPFGLASVRAESAGFGEARGENSLLIPIIRVAELPAFIARACPRFAAEPKAGGWHGPPPRALRRYVMSPVWAVLGLATVGTVAAGFAPWIGWRWGLASLPLAVPAAALGLARYRAAGWRLHGDGRLLVRSRPLQRVTTITRPSRLQLRELSQHVLQRRARLATFRAAVASHGAGGTLAVAHVDRDDGLRLLDRLGPARDVRLLDNPSPRP